MNYQFTHPEFLWLLVPVLAWTAWCFLKSGVQTHPWRRRTALTLRVIVALLLLLAIAGFQWKKPLEGMNVFYLIDRSDSVPEPEQGRVIDYVNAASTHRDQSDRGGVLVFGGEAAIEFNPSAAVELHKINAVIDTKRTDIAAAIRLATAAFPEHGQKRLVLFTDGNENVGDALGALTAARPLGVTMDVVPLTVGRGGDVSVQKLALPGRLLEGQTFESKIFVESDRATTAKLRLFQNDQFIGEQDVELQEGKNLFSFPQTLDAPGFYNYTVQVDAPGDVLPQNNRATAFTDVRGDPRVLIVSDQPALDGNLVDALVDARLEVNVVSAPAMTGSLAELRSYDSIILANVSAGDLGMERMRLLESAVRDFGVGLVAIGGDNTFTAGGFRNTPLETTLPISMELNSKKVLPAGALVIVAHATEFPGGNQWARDIAFAALQALGPQDEMGVVMWDGFDKWLFELQPVGDKRDMGRMIAGMNIGDMPSFQNVMDMAHKELAASTAHLKHMVVFSDGDPTAPTAEQMQGIADSRITVSTVMIGGHVAPERMIWMADVGGGRFYDVSSPELLPQIFVKESAVILKSAIFEEPFQPQLAVNSELVRGLGGEFPLLRGYVTTEPKPRAETPLLTEKGDPLLAHWNYGLGRAVAFTSDARAKWAADWMNWENYRRFWAQIVNWSLRRLESADFTTEIAIEAGRGTLSVEALDDQGDFRNFLNLQAAVVGPTGERETVRLEQTAPGRYEVAFDTRDVGTYLVNLMELDEEGVRGAMPLGASVNYSPEFNDSAANAYLLERLAAAGGGSILDLNDPATSSFQLNREQTFQPRDLWPWLLRIAILLFILDVAIRRIHLGREELAAAGAWINTRVLLRKPAGEARPDESLSALLARRDQVRSRRPTPVAAPSEELFKPKRPVAVEAKPQDLADTSKASGPKSAPKGPQPEAESTTSRLLEAKRRARKK